jgi:TRAP-type C4-dicarboxylate transport system permease small subunit
MKTVTLAQSLNLGNQTIEGPLKNINTLGDLVSMVLKLVVPLAAVILLFVLIWGGYDYMMSQGNAEKIKSAQGKITTGLIGFILLILSFFIVRLIAAIFGLGSGIF